MDGSSHKGIGEVYIEYSIHLFIISNPCLWLDFFGTHLAYHDRFIPCYVCPNKHCVQRIGIWNTLWWMLLFVVLRIFSLKIKDEINFPHRIIRRKWRVTDFVIVNFQNMTVGINLICIQAHAYRFIVIRCPISLWPNRCKHLDDQYRSVSSCNYLKWWSVTRWGVPKISQDVAWGTFVIFSLRHKWNVLLWFISSCKVKNIHVTTVSFSRHVEF